MNIPQGYLAEFRGGPITGQRLFITALSDTVQITCDAGTGEARYERDGEHDGIPQYAFREYRDLRSQEDQVKAAMLEFYTNYNPSIYSRAPGLHSEVLVEVGHRRGPVDEGLADIVRAIWERDWETLASCQQLPHDEGDIPVAYITFPIGQQGKAFINLLAQHGIETRSAAKTGTMHRLNQEHRPYVEIKAEQLDVFFQAADLPKVLAAIKSD
jgi:hypothetical protein